MKSRLIALTLILAGLIPVGLSAQQSAQQYVCQSSPEYTITITVRPGDPEYPKPLNLREVYQQLHYPKACHDKGIEGRVVARLKVNAKGEVIQTATMKSDHALFEQEVNKHLKQIRFEAKADRPNVWVTIPFQFKMQESSNG